MHQIRFEVQRLPLANIVYLDGAIDANNFTALAAVLQDLLTGHKVSLLLYNSQATSPVTESIKALAGQSGVPVVGLSETIPRQDESFVQWQLAQLNEIETALGGSP